VEIASKRLWLDDVRRPPSDEWTWAKSVEEAIEILATKRVVEASLDHDLHPFQRDGMEVCLWMQENDVWPHRVRIHSSNRSASTKMCGLLERNGYRRALGQPRSFIKSDGIRMSAAEFVTLSIRNSPKTMEKLRRADAGEGD
jgi:hypothetical protein